MFAGILNSQLTQLCLIELVSAPYEGNNMADISVMRLLNLCGI